MWFFYVIALPLVLLVVAYGLLWLPSESTGWFVRLDVGLSWFAALATLLLVPSDIASSLQQQQEQHSSQPPSSSHSSSSSHLSQWWVASYWFSFISQVLILPLHMEYTRSGDFTIKDRLLASLRYNVFYYLILLAIGFGGVIVLMASGSLKPSNVVGFAIAFSNAYGLAAAIFLMGYGLVAIPKELWKRADAGGERLRLYHYAGLQAERVQGAHRRLSAAVLMARKTSALFSKSDPMRKYMDMVLELAASVGDFKFSMTSIPEGAELDFFDKSDLARLRRHLKSSLKDYEREKALYVEAVERYLNLEERAARADVAMKPADDAPLMDKVVWFRDSWQLHYWAYRLAAIAATAASVAVVVAETTVSASLPDSSIVSLSLRSAATGRHHSFFLVQFLSSGFLAYPVYCAYYSLYKMGQVAFYRLVPRHTDAYSLCYSGFLMTRFAAPLAFNFLAAIALPTKKGETVGAGGTLPDVTSTVFYHEFGELMSRQPLIGWQFTTFAPAALGPYVLLLAIGFFDPLVKTVGNMLRTLFGSSSGDGIEEAAVNIRFEDDFELRSGYADSGRRLLMIEAENARMMMRMGGNSSSGVVPIGQTAEPVSGETLESLESQGLLDLVEEKQPWFQRVFPSKFVDRINNNNNNSTAGRGGGGGRNNNSSSSSNNRRDDRQRAPEVEEARSRLSRTVGKDSISNNIDDVASSSSSMTASLLSNDRLNNDIGCEEGDGGGGGLSSLGRKSGGWRNKFLGDQ